MDQQIEILMNRLWISPWSDRVMAFVSDFGAWKVWLLLLVIVAAVFGTFRLRAALLSAILAVGLSDGVGVNFLKHAVARPRPSQVEPGVRVVTLGAPPCGLPAVAGLFSDPLVSFPHGMTIPEEGGILPGISGRSFPSGHAANNMAVATVLILFFRWRGALYLIPVLMVCWSRIYTGAHWPLDVLAGMVLGILGGILGPFLLTRLWHWLGPKLFPGTFSHHPRLFP